MQIASVETGTVAGVLQITLSDGSRFFVLENLWRKSGLDDACSVDQLQQLQWESEKTQVEQKAVELLARREYSQRELCLRLQQRGFGEQAVRRVVDDLAARGLQDDHRFALAWLRSRLRRRPQSAALLLLGLRSKGLSSEAAAAALAQFGRDNPGWEEDALERALERLQRGGSTSERRLVAGLARLGFGAAAIRRVVERGSQAD